MLAGQLVVLREWRESDLEFLSLLRNDIDLQVQLMSRPRPNSLANVRAWLMEKSSNKANLFFVVADKSNDTASGYLQITKLDLEHGHGELGICIDPTQHGKGMAAESLAILETYLINTFALRKLVLHVLVENQRAIRFYQKCGFEEVGILRKHFYLKTAHHDALIMEKHLSK